MNTEVDYLLSLRAIRERAELVATAAGANKLNHFDVHEKGLEEATELVVSLIKRDYGPDKYDTIPPHGRWQHFEVGGKPRIEDLLKSWKAAKCDDKECARRLIDLFFVSVLLDAGAGDTWRYIEPGTKNTYERSEGIAIASLYMFIDQAFTGAKSEGIPVVDGKGLVGLSEADMELGFQNSEKNSILGIKSRTELLNSLGKSLNANPEVFGKEGRPGNLVDFLIKSANNSTELDILVLWDTLQKLLIPVWPKDRTSIQGCALGDAWPLGVLSSNSKDAREVATTIQPFHKLTQWLTYSLMVPFQRILNLEWKNADSLTALAEYRNGGLLVDCGALRLKQSDLERGQKESGTDLPLFDASDDVVVEWRAMTIVLLDRLYDKVLAQMGIGVQLSMAQVLEAGTWKSGREIAAKLRPNTKSSPILIRSDGTVF